MQRIIAVVMAFLLVASVAGAGKKAKPATAKTQIEFGIKMAQQGLWSEALFRFEQAEKLGASSTTVYNNMAVAYEALGAFERARDSYRRALEKDPSNTALRGNYARFVEFYQSFKPEGEAESGQAPEESEALEDGQAPEDGLGDVAAPSESSPSDTGRN